MVFQRVAAGLGRGIERLADWRPELDIDMALAEQIYRELKAKADVGTAKAPEAIFCLGTAAAWKIACAEFKAGHGLEAAAHAQYLYNLEYFQQQLEQHARDGFPAAPLDSAMIRCAVAQARLNGVEGSESLREAAAAEGRASANELFALPEKNFDSDAVDCLASISGLQLAADVLADAARSQGPTRDVRVALRRQAIDLGRLCERTCSSSSGDHRPSDDDTSQTSQVLLSKVALARAQAELAHADDDFAAEKAILQRAQSDARALREAAQADWYVGQLPWLSVAFAWSEADGVELSLAEMLDDDDLRRSVTSARDEAFGHFVVGDCGIIQQGRLNLRDKIFTVLLATDRLETLGEAPLEHSITQFGRGLAVTGPRHPETFDEGDLLLPMEFELPDPLDDSNADPPAAEKR